MCSLFDVGKFISFMNIFPMFVPTFSSWVEPINVSDSTFFYPARGVCSGDSGTLKVGGTCGPRLSAEKWRGQIQAVSLFLYYTTIVYTT